MPARVDYRLGSIFDEECDLLVIPSSTAGTVTPPIRQAIHALGIPQPVPMKQGAILLTEFSNERFRSVAFASAVGGHGSRPASAAVEEIGQRLGALAFTYGHISVPLLGTGAGGITPLTAAKSLESGFLSTAPDGARLVVSVLDDKMLAAAGRRVGWASVSMHDAAPTPADPAPAPTAAPPRAAPTPGASPKRSRVFISYSHADAEWLERLQKHLRPLERDGAMVWADTRIKAGAQWRDEIREALAETKVAVLLVSADFMASEFIVTNELPPLLKAAEEEGATILPVIISASSFLRTPSLSRFQAVNNPDKPLVQLRKGNRERVMDDVARAVEDALKR